MNLKPTQPTSHRPKGLAARGMIWAVAVVLTTASLCAVSLVSGAQNESAQRQQRVMAWFGSFAARYYANLTAAGDLGTLQGVVDAAAADPMIRSVEIVSADGAPLARSGPWFDDVPRFRDLVRRTGQIASAEANNGSFVVGAPLFSDSGSNLGVAVVVWEADAYAFNIWRALAPFLIVAACLTLMIVPLTISWVRRMTAPLDALTNLARRIAEGDDLSPVEVRTGDEFETLANAFNSMISRLQGSLRRIQEIAFIDPATQLPNQDRLAAAVDLALLQDGMELGAVAAFDFQRVTKLRQTLDPTAARDLCRAVADHLITATRVVDRVMRTSLHGSRPAIAARLGEDEFAVFAPRIGSPTDAARYVQHLNAALNQPFDWRGHKLVLESHCGVAFTPRDGTEAHAVIRRARLALSAAYATPSRIRLFTPSLDREAQARLTLEREMRGALDRGEFRAFFQPMINLKSGRIEGCEALARWVRPDKTIVGPARFIPVAEESGLISALSDAVMREACWKAAAWSRAGRPIKVAVNVSALQFRDERFSQKVLRTLDHAGLSPSQLELEITESVALEDTERALRTIAPLREAGVRFAIDDFGCGHSSLGALSKLPFDVIKIDQQFVRAIGRGDRQGTAIIDMILALAKSLDMEVVGEGVERQADMDFLRMRDCHWVQGFLTGAAVSAPAFAELLRRQACEEVIAEDAA